MKTSLITSIACLVLAVNASAQSYSYKDLGTVGAYVNILPTAINSNGEIAGNATQDSADYHLAFRYSAGNITLIASPGVEHFSYGNAINSAGTVVGDCKNGGTTHEFYARPGFAAVDPDPDFSRFSRTLAINDNEWVVGQHGPLIGNWEPFLGHENIILPLSPWVGANFIPAGLNNNWDIVGNVPSFGAVLFNALTGTNEYLGFSLGSWVSHAAAINKNRTVAGVMETPAGKLQGFLYTSGSPVTFFGLGVVEEVNGLNSQGDVVGTIEIPGSARHPFVYLKAGNKIVDLTTAVSSSITAVWRLDNATGINDKGEICGWAWRPSTPADGVSSGTITHGFKLTPNFRIQWPVVGVQVVPHEDPYDGGLEPPSFLPRTEIRDYPETSVRR